VGGVSVDALWYFGRGTGVVCLVLLSLSLVLGIGARSGRPAPWLPRFGVAALHRNVGLLGFVFLVLHVGLLLFDPYAQFDLLDVVAPFLAGYAPVWLGLGTLALDLLLAVLVTSALRRRLGRRTWRAVHWCGYACWPPAVAHSLGSGTDNDRFWLLALVVACVAAVVGALVWRLAADFTEHGVDRAPIPRARAAARR
jgi:sulfoxide reductase heme-binding subunit YedZ